MLSYCSTVARRTTVVQGLKTSGKKNLAFIHNNNNRLARNYGGAGWRGMPIKLIDVSLFLLLLIFLLNNTLLCLDGLYKWGGRDANNKLMMDRSERTTYWLNANS